MKKNKKQIYMILSILFICSAFIFMVWFFLKGERTVSGKYPDDYTSQTLRCSGDNIGLSYMPEQNYSSGSSYLTAIFDNDKFTSASLVQFYEYDNEAQANHAEAILRANVNTVLAKYDLAKKVDANYNLSQNKLRFSLSFSSGKLSPYEIRKLYMIENSEDNLESYYHSFMNLGFHCNIDK